MSILPDHAEVVVAGQADVAALGRQLDALVGLGAIADQVAQAPRAVGAARSTSASTASNAGRFPCTSESSAMLSGVTVTVTGTNGESSPAAPARPGGGGRRGGGGDAAPAAAERADRPGPGCGASLLQPRAARPGRATSTAAAADRRRLAARGGAVALWLGAAPAAAVRRLLERGGARRWARAVAGAGISVVLVVAGLPLVAADQRARGLRALDPGLGLVDRRRAQGPLISAVLAALGARCSWCARCAASRATGWRPAASPWWC